MEELQILAEEICEKLDNVDLGIVYTDILATYEDDLSAELECEFVSHYFPKGDCEYWLLSTIIQKVVDDISDKHNVSLATYVQDIGIRNHCDETHIYVQFRVTIG